MDLGYPLDVARPRKSSIGKAQQGSEVHQGSEPAQNQSLHRTSPRTETAHTNQIWLRKNVVASEFQNQVQLLSVVAGALSYS